MTQEELIQAIDRLQKSAALNLDINSFAAFLKKNVNGDDYIDGLPLNAILSKDRRGLLIYVLTSAKLIKIEADKNGFGASSYYLTKIEGINRSVINAPNNGQTLQIKTDAPQDSFGLRYGSEDKDVDTFFLKVEGQLRKIKLPSNG